MQKQVKPTDFSFASKHQHLCLRVGVKSPTVQFLLTIALLVDVVVQSHEMVCNRCYKLNSF